MLLCLIRLGHHKLSSVRNDAHVYLTAALMHHFTNSKEFVFSMTEYALSQLRSLVAEDNIESNRD